MNIAEEAMQLIAGDRLETYGPPNEFFERIADLWDSLLVDSVLKTRNIDEADVIHCMIALKLLRDRYKRKRDNAVDIIGYLLLLEQLGYYPRKEMKE